MPNKVLYFMVCVLTGPEAHYRRQSRKIKFAPRASRKPVTFGALLANKILIDSILQRVCFRARHIYRRGASARVYFRRLTAALRSRF